MAIAYVTGFTKGGTHNGSSLVITVSGLTVGDTLLIHVAGTSGMSVTGITDNASPANVYTQGPTQDTNKHTEIWYVKSLGAAPTSITISLSGATESSACVEEYSGVMRIGVSASASGSSTAPAVTLTTQDANNWVAMCGGASGSGTWSATSPNVVRHSIASATTGGEVITASLDGGAFASAGSHTVTGKLSTSEAWGAVALELRSTAGNNPSVTATDSESFSDSTGENVALGRGIAETESFSESATEKISASRSAADAQSFSDTLIGNRGVSRTAADSTSFSESVARGLALSPSLVETHAFSESQTENAAFIRAVADSETLSDALTKASGLTRTASDALSLSDALARIAGATCAMTDSASLSETVARNVQLQKAISDAAAFSEALNRSVMMARLAADGESFSDVAASQTGGGSSANVTATDALTFSESLARILATARAAADSLSLSESSARIVQLLRAANDREAFADSISGGAQNWFPALVDSFLFSEAIQSASSAAPKQKFKDMIWQLALREAASDIVTDRLLAEFSSPLPIQLDYQLAANAPLAQIDTFISSQSVPNSAAWGKGSYVLTLVVKNGMNVSFTIELWRTDASGNDIAQIGSRPALIAGPSVGPATFMLTVSDAIGQQAETTDRLKLKLFAENSAANAETFSILASASFITTPIERAMQVSNIFNGYRRGRFLGSYRRDGEGSGYFDKNGIDIT